jgi:hypothetical protein
VIAWQVAYAASVVVGRPDIIDAYAVKSRESGRPDNCKPVACGVNSGRCR